MTSDPFAELHHALAACAAVDPATLPDVAVADAVEAWCSATARLQVIGVGLLARWGHTRAWEDDGAPNPTQWLRSHGQLDSARRTLRIAGALQRAPKLLAALDAGEISYGHAAAIAPAAVGPHADAFANDEEILVDAAKTLTIAQTERLMAMWRRVAENEVHPDVDPDEVRYQRRYLRLVETFDGMYRIDGLLDPATGAALAALIAELERQYHRQDVAEAHAAATTPDVSPPAASPTPTDTPTGSPPRPDPAASDGPGRRPTGVADDPHLHHPEGGPLLLPESQLGRTAPQRRADALAELLALWNATGPLAGGPRATLHITATWEQLQHAANPDHPPGPSGFDPDHIPPHTDQGHRIPDPALAMAACDCVLHRVIINADGVPLDVGRLHRLATPAIRRALIQRDGGCAFPDCDRGPQWCDAHHIIPWENQGPTSLDNLVLLCGYHHRRMHTRNAFTCRIDTPHDTPQFFRPDGTPHVGAASRRRWQPPPRDRSPSDPPWPKAA